MRQIAVTALAFAALALTALSTASLRGEDAADATQPANVVAVDVLLQRIEQLERRVQQLEGTQRVATKAPPRSPVTPSTLPPRLWQSLTAPAEAPVVIQGHDGVLRADQVKIYLHYQVPVIDAQTADRPRPAVQPAGFQSGGIRITR
jgi:hypothetical protein